MGVLDRWLKSFLKEGPAPPPSPTPRAPHSSSSSTSSTSSTSDAHTQSGPSNAVSRIGQHAAAARGAPHDVEPGHDGSRTDPLDEALRRARARLTADAQGRAYAEGGEFSVELAALDAGGRTKAADALLADALLVSPSRLLRRTLAERLLHRGDRTRAKTLLEKLVEPSGKDGSDLSKDASFALTALAEIAEAEGDVDTALLR